MIKKRYIVILCLFLLIVLGSFVAFTKPVLPYIQLPGEIYPGTEGIPVLGGVTNTFVASSIAWILVVLLGFSLKARSRTADEVPSGFYNFFEMVYEGAYGFAENIAGKKVKDFFPFFMTVVLFLLTANWMGLVPGVDSIGLWEHKPHFLAAKAEKAAKADGHSFDFAQYEHQIDAENVGDLRYKFSIFGYEFPLFGLLIRKENAIEGAAYEAATFAGNTVNAGRNPEAADWTIVPFVRPAATDLNLTLALAVMAMVLVQFYGFKYLGVRGYLSKFFPFVGKGWGQQVAKNPIKAIDPAVGILELVSEISKIISFAFRLLGNIFAGMVLLFVMSFLLPAANMVFYGLEFFIGLIQALVFALLSLIFMSSATESHHGDDDDHH